MHVRLTNTAVKKNVMKLVKLQNLVAKCCKNRKYSLAKFANFQYIWITCGNCYHFRLKNGNNFRT
jgi:hypothetical protein